MKPSVGRQLLAFGAITIFLGLAVILLWSDRAPSVFGDVLDIVRRTGRSVERRYDIDLIDRSDIPGQADQIGHALFWGTGMLIAGWVLRRRVPVAITALFLSGISMLFEFAQPALSATRAVEPSDAVANIIGIVVATVALLAVLAATRWFRGDDRHYHGDMVFFEEEPTDEYFLH